ncbi:MAG: L-seryl-tRNA(Sec) selenium transferase [Chloroflexi bacterium]|nr:L-seryl-tRNA(Sec) selenium transferase [Chloroflexota bacterium]
MKQRPSQRTTTGYRHLPSVDRVLAQEDVQALLSTYPHDLVVSLVRQELEQGRRTIADGGVAPSLAEVAAGVVQRARSLAQRWPRPVINATGVVLHTNLGRAPLSGAALQAIADVARGYSDLEYDLPEGQRGSRQSKIASLLCQVTGAEAGLAVNNNAAAVLLGLAAIASGREVIVSRGEAVEIGGRFRIPDVLAQSGATLVEVGTTNRTYLSDYEAGITERTAAILKVHASNFRVLGFTESPSLADLVALARQRGLPVLHDIGSGCLLDTAQFGLAHEPTPQESLAAGCALVFFSGDKLLGGPQAGLIVGQREVVQRLERHPLARAVRLDKLTLAALDATMRHYLKGEATQAIPIWRMIALTQEQVRLRAEAWARALGPRAELAQGLSTIGGGSLPGETLPTWLVALDAHDIPGGAQELARRLRRGEPPAVARIEEERVLLDPRTVLPEEDEGLLGVVRKALLG